MAKHIRDQEIERLVNYIKGLGLKIRFSSKKVDYAADWLLDNSQITVYKTMSSSKIDTILSIIHELGHCLHNVHEKDRQVDTLFSNALDSVAEAEDQELDSKKRHRKIILDNELAGTRYWSIVYKDCNLKFPIWRLELAMELDVWQYQIWYETSKDPTRKERKEKYKELFNKHRYLYDND